MYLDTDIILAIVKPADWLKDVVASKLKMLSDLKTSVFTIVEAQIVLNRETTREITISVLDTEKDEVLSGNRRKKNCHTRDLISFVAAKSMGYKFIV